MQLRIDINAQVPMKVVCMFGILPHCCPKCGMEWRYQSGVNQYRCPKCHYDMTVVRNMCMQFERHVEQADNLERLLLLQWISYLLRLVRDLCLLYIRFAGLRLYYYLQNRMKKSPEWRQFLSYGIADKIGWSLSFCISFCLVLLFIFCPLFAYIIYKHTRYFSVIRSDYLSVVVLLYLSLFTLLTVKTLILDVLIAPGNRISKIYQKIVILSPCLLFAGICFVNRQFHWHFFINDLTPTLLVLWIVVTTGYTVLKVFVDIKEWKTHKIPFQSILFFLFVVTTLTIVHYMLVFTAIWRLIPNSFEGIGLPSIHDPLHMILSSFSYFSIVTFTTVGYGDIYPKHFISRIAVASEIIIGYSFAIYIITFLSSLPSRVQHDQNTVRPTNNQLHKRKIYKIRRYTAGRRRISPIEARRTKK